jgi:SAM-dependent methyltransferase
MVTPDYQIFDLVNGHVENVGPRMEQKLHALRSVLPEDLTGKTVLDIGCDFGFWSFLCSQRGASSVLGLDRGRKVRGEYVNLPEMNNERAGGTTCEFQKANIGGSWPCFGKFDVTLLMSLYHHIYHQAESHLPIWYWLFRHTRDFLIWENPTDSSDSVVKMNVSGHLHPKYQKKYILEAASEYFNYKYIGPAEHEPTRHVYKFTPRKLQSKGYWGWVKSGAGGASKAFEYADGRRINEIEKMLGIKCYPGSLNIHLETEFDWNRHYFRGMVSDVANRNEGLEGHWIPRWARFYPVNIAGVNAYVFRFETDQYPGNFVELISDKRLRDHVGEMTSIRHVA